MRFSARPIFLFFILYSLFAILFTSPASAQAKTPSATPTQSVQPASNTSPDVSNNIHNWTQTVMIETMSALTCQLTDVDPTNPKQACLGVDQKSGKIGFISPSTSSGYASGGAIGVMGNMITVLYTPPLHTSDYFQNLAQNFGLAKHAYAQGIGFKGLSPLINIWSAFRNIAYIIFVIVFVVIGMAIMLRVKIDPRTVMTIQNSIPKIIIGILLVTFSFAVAGFLVDMMYVLIYFFFNIVSGMDVDVGNLNPAIIQGETAIGSANAMGGNFGVSGIASNVSFGLGTVLKDIIGVKGCDNALNCLNSLFNPLDFVFNTKGISALNIIYNLISASAGWFTFYQIMHVPTGGLDILGTFIRPLAAIPSSIGAYALSQFMLREVLPWIIVYLIILIALLYALFRLWFTLLMAYIFILLHTVLAPFWIIAGIVPGSQISFSGWIRDFAANILVFPATIGMFLIGKAFMDVFSKGPAANNFVPPLIGNMGTDPSPLGSLIGLGIILTTPTVLNALKQMLKAPKIDLSSVMQSFGAGTGTLTAPFKPVISGFSFLAGQKMAQKIPFVGQFARASHERIQQEEVPRKTT